MKKIMLDTDFIKGDHLSNASVQAFKLYIYLLESANLGFVSNVKQLLDMLGFDKSILKELIDIGEILTLPNRDEVFVTAYFVHNNGLKNQDWFHCTPYGIYWTGKLFIKPNGVATFNPKKKNKFDRELDKRMKKRDQEQLEEEGFEDISATPQEVFNKS